MKQCAPEKGKRRKHRKAAQRNCPYNGKLGRLARVLAHAKPRRGDTFKVTPHPSTRPSPIGAACHCAGQPHAAPLGLMMVPFQRVSYKHVAPMELGSAPQQKHS